MPPKGPRPGTTEQDIGYQQKTYWQSFLYFLQTIWLFTYSDLVSILYPETIFGISSALAGHLLTTNSNPSIREIFANLPYVVLWTWANLLLLCLANQRLPESIAEDAINKPWRPLPSRRITPRQSGRLLLISIPVVFFACKYYLGGTEASLALMVFNWMYNDIGGANENYILRNIFNALGFVAFQIGATEVACGVGHTINTGGWQWMCCIGTVIFFTIPLQDMYDQEGDAARNRSTAPLVLGDGVARWTIVAPIMAWSVICPAFWRLDIWPYVVVCLLGGSISLRLLLCKSAKDDRVTFKMWCFWTILLYQLPLLKKHQTLSFG